MIPLVDQFQFYKFGKYNQHYTNNIFFLDLDLKIIIQTPESQLKNY